ncbi:MAG: DUF2459 domain-containing protein [Gammaproteobacteria bacterium]
MAAGCATSNTSSRLTTGQTNPAPKTTADEEQIWVLDSGWYTGLVLSRAELDPSLTRLLQTIPTGKYFMFGWGNRRFYMAPNPSLGMDIAALFPSRSVVLVETCDTPPRDCYSSAVKLRVVSVSRAGLQRLDDYLAHSLQNGAHAQLEPLAPGPDADSEFYASGLSYDAFHTCNTWTAEALHVAGLPVDYHGVIFANQLWRKLK